MMQRFSHVDSNLPPLSKFDLQLHRALVDQDRLAQRLQSARIELKTENHQWERTGNICIEYRHKGKPSGIASTTAHWWVHELARGEETLAYLWVPVPRLLAVCLKTNVRRTGGDGGNSRVFLLRLSDILCNLGGG